jgi:predicted amidohydrolase
MKVAAIQMTSGSDYHQNMLVAKSLISEAAFKKTRLIVLPEMFACIGVSNQAKLAEQFFTEKKLVETIGQWAKDNDVYIVAGSVPFTSVEKNRVYAACFVFSPKGEILAQYNKIHLFDVSVGDEKGTYRESDTFVAGDVPVIADIDGKRLGLSICYDLRFPELYQHYQATDCIMMSVPSAFTHQTGKQHWEVLLRARAIENQCFIIAANQSGSHDDGRKTWGHSMIVSPSGEILDVVLKEGEGMAIADLNFEEQALLKSAMPLSDHKRL